MKLPSKYAAMLTQAFELRPVRDILVDMRKFLLVPALAVFVFAQEKVDDSNIARFRSEAVEHPQIMHTLHMLTDRYGPRVTGTPNHEAAAKWVMAEMTRW